MNMLFSIRQKKKKITANVVFFSFSEADRDAVLALKTKAMDPQYTKLNFMVQDLMRRWRTEDLKAIRRAVEVPIAAASRTIVLVGKDTYKSMWVTEEVTITLEQGKPVYAIYLKNRRVVIPACLKNNDIYVYPSHEENLQYLATRKM
jgi:hypothetical protein